MIEVIKEVLFRSISLSLKKKMVLKRISSASHKFFSHILRDDDHNNNNTDAVRKFLTGIISTSWLLLLLQYLQSRYHFHGLLAFLVNTCEKTRDQIGFRLDFHSIQASWELQTITNYKLIQITFFFESPFFRLKMHFWAKNWAENDDKKGIFDYFWAVF